MQSILFSIDKLRPGSPASMMVSDLAGWFLRHGWAVDIDTFRMEGSCRRHIRKLAERGPLQVFTGDSDPQQVPAQATAYDILWISGGYLSESLIDRIAAGRVKGNVIFQHSSESPAGPGYHRAEPENRLAWRTVTDSALQFAALCVRGISAPSLRLLPLAWDDDETCADTAAVGKPLQAILWSAEQVPDDFAQLTRLLKLQNIRLDLLLPSQQKAITNRQLADYQLVIGEHRIIARALCLGIPAIVAGRGRWQGYLSSENLQTASDSFFAAAGGQNTDCLALLQELTNGYATARCWAESFRTEAMAGWSFSALLPSLLETLPVGKTLSLTPDGVAEWHLNRRVLEEQVLTSQPLRQWLHHRQISDTRRMALSAIVRAQNDHGEIGVIILDSRQDRDACEITLLSLQQQSLAPCHCVVISEREPGASVLPSQVPLFASPGGPAVMQAAGQFPATSWLIVEAGTRCLPDCLLLFAAWQLEHPSSEICYSDILLGENSEEARLILRPDCNIDLLRSQHYPGEELLITTACLKRVMPPQLVAPRLMCCELIWRVIETAGPQAVTHLSECLLQVPERVSLPRQAEERREITLQHLQRCGAGGWPEAGKGSHPDILHYPVPLQGCVSIIIVTQDHPRLLKRCLDSLTTFTDWPDYELLIIDNQSQESDAVDYLRQLQALRLRNLKVLHWTEAFNFAAINNYAATEARGDYLLFLNNDCQLTEPGWLNALLEVAQRPEVGIAGARQLYSDGSIQHAGFVTGIGEGAEGIYPAVPAETPGYFHYLQTVHEVSAVSASCMIIRREVFDDAGGFDAVQFADGLADIDLCLRVRQAGYLVLWTPLATLYHMGGATRLSAARYQAEAAAEKRAFEGLRQRWKEKLCTDIRYHRHLNREGHSFGLSLRTDRLQLPLPGRPLPVMIAGHVNFTGCGNYRVIQPYQLLEQQCLLEGGLIHGLPGAMDVAELQPDIVLLQMPFDPQIEETLRQYRQLSSAKIIMEYDDYFVNLPLKNHNRRHLPKDIVGQLRRTMAGADHLVVSTEALAEAYAGFHSDIRVALNRLNPEQWGALSSQRQCGKKLRIGWAGGNSHEGDLAIIRPLAEALQDEVEWVFMGMKPARVSCEFHCGVPFGLYPQKLASLNLDLALVPLEMNLFNECKSNLRLLELGACGIPVICSDIEPYQGDLPVTRVKNNFRHWLKAIREHLAEPTALGRQGDLLQQAIRRDWLLTRENGNDWLQGWLG